jgi:hypothetical protein
VTKLEMGDYHSCVITTGGGVKCWGDNFSGQLGDGTNIDKHQPVDVSGGLSGITSLAGGYNHTCALSIGAVPLRCWGNNENGQFGDGTTTGSNIPKNSKWLTADGLIEDSKTTVILPVIPDTAVVILAQPVDEPAVVTATVVEIPPTICTECMIYAMLYLDDKLPVHSFFHLFNISNQFGSSAFNTQVAGPALDERTLNLYKYVGGTWIPMLPCTGCSLDTTNHSLTASLDGPGIYAVMSREKTVVYLPLSIR